MADSDAKLIFQTGLCLFGDICEGTHHLVLSPRCIVKLCSQSCGTIIWKLNRSPDVLLTFVFLYLFLVSESIGPREDLRDSCDGIINSCPKKEPQSTKMIVMRVNKQQQQHPLNEDVCLLTKYLHHYIRSTPMLAPFSSLFWRFVSSWFASLEVQYRLTLELVNDSFQNFPIWNNFWNWCCEKSFNIVACIRHKPK